MTELSLFDDLVDEQQNNCAADPGQVLRDRKQRAAEKANANKGKGKKEKKPATSKSPEERRVEEWSKKKIPNRIWVKMYSEWHLFEKPEGEATLEDVRRWMVGMGYTELSPGRANLEVVDPVKSLEPQKIPQQPVNNNTENTEENAEPVNEEQPAEVELVPADEDPGQPGDKPYVFCSVVAKTFG